MEFVKKTVTKTVEYIEYDGKRFYKDKRGYWLGSQKDEEGKQKRIRLHIYVWEKHNGPIPEGYHIHHIDHDPDNNDISNLAMLSKEEHQSLHVAEMTDAKRDQARKSVVAFAVPASKTWHKSEEGLAWHREHAKTSILPMFERKTKKICDLCGKEFEAFAAIAHRTRFCSSKCRTAHRYRSGVDNEERTCIICGAVFTTNKYSRVKTCCKGCANASESISKTGAPRPPRKDS